MAKIDDFLIALTPIGASGAKACEPGSVVNRAASESECNVIMVK